MSVNWIELFGRNGEAMKVCTYDNPNTMARECWRDGKLVCSYAADALLRKLEPWETQSIPKGMLFSGANIGDWKTGQMVGDPEAMRPNVPVKPGREATSA